MSVETEAQVTSVLQALRSAHGRGVEGAPEPDADDARALLRRLPLTVDAVTWRSRFYAAFTDVEVVRRGSGLLNRWRTPDAPELDRLARVAAEAVAVEARARGGVG